MAAIEGGGIVVLANKEPLVSAGRVILDAARRHRTTLLPADSEHNAIYQCFDFARPERVRRIVLTASGGPFRDYTTEQMAPRHRRPGGRAPPIGRWAPRSRSIRRR